jgi:alkylation response protein AidB-like acyl-CoA dehydrogenase
MLSLKQYRAAEELEGHLGDPLNPQNVMSFKRAVELDEREEYPSEACALLNSLNYQHYYIPHEHGGRLESFEQLFSLIRVVSRRDMTVGLTHATTYAAGSVVWTSGTTAQKRMLAGMIKGGEQIALGVHEQAHGSDLLACETRATKTAADYMLTGEKWVISNPRRSAALVVFARTAPQGGPRGFSLLLVDKKSLPEESYSYLPKVKTHGARGHETSGIRFQDCLIPEAYLLASEGSGLETALKSFQVTRTLFTAQTLGAADTALRTTLDFALSRNLYGATVFDIPSSRRVLADAFLDILICDCVAFAALRALHVVTEQASVCSAVAKYFIPTTVDKLVQELSTVLGARYYLREGHWSGIFQKIVRDTPFSSLAHYGSILNLSHLITQLPQLSRHQSKTESEQDSATTARLAAIFSLGRALPKFEPGNLALNSRGRDDILQGLKTAPAQLRRLRDEASVDAGVLEDVIRLAGELVEEVRACEPRWANPLTSDEPSSGSSTEAFELAHRYCVLYAASSCIQMWLHNREALGDFFLRGEWLALCLERLLKTFRVERGAFEPSRIEHVAHEARRLYSDDKLFSVVPMQLARTEISAAQSARHGI